MTESPRTTRIKFCGITRPQDAEVAAEAGAWAIGLIFVPSSDRFVSADAAAEVLSALPEGVLTVGVFANQSATVIEKVCERLPLDLIQLHGHETNEHCEAIGPQRVIKSVVMFDESDVARMATYKAAYLLVDQPKEGLPESRPEVNPVLAGQLIARSPQVLVAGGLNPGNVGALIRAVKPWGVDVASGIEERPGIKNAGAIRAFADAVREADAALATAAERESER